MRSAFVVARARPAPVPPPTQRQVSSDGGYFSSRFARSDPREPGMDGAVTKQSSQWGGDSREQIVNFHFY